MSHADSTYEQLIKPIESRMIQTVWRVLRDPDDADDAMQEALSRIWRRLKQIERHPNPKALLLRMTANTAYDMLRRRIRRQKHESPQLVPATLRDSRPNPSDRLLQRQCQVEISAAISRLPRNNAIAILMRLVQEQPYEAIAEALGCSPATARIHVSRGRAKLRQKLAHLLPLLGNEVRS